MTEQDSAMKTGNWGKCWALLDARERRMAWIVLAVVILAALFSAVMVGSILPFLTVLSDLSKIETMVSLSWAYDQFGFKSNFDFVVALGLASLMVIVLASLINIAKVYVVARFANMRMHSISLRLLNSYLSQPYAFFLDRHSGEMGTRILSETEQVVKFFLHLGYDEQRDRFLQRIDKPHKNWKFEDGDIRERRHWSEFQEAYEETINATAAENAPWYVVPADDKKNMRLIVAQILLDQLKSLDMKYPDVTDERREELKKDRKLLEND
jgi:ABC-type multidrug transport system fused ATPase/permease subunit